MLLDRLTRNPLFVILCLVTLIAVGLSIYLLLATLAGASLAGCDETSSFDCDEILASRWSKWINIPVSAFGIVNYGLIFISLLMMRPIISLKLRKMAFSLYAMAIYLAVGAGLWFLGLQALKLDGYCLYCLGVHCCGVLLLLILLASDLIRRDHGDQLKVSMIKPLIPAVIGLAVLIGGQILVKPPVQHINEIAFDENKTTGSIDLTSDEKSNNPPSEKSIETKPDDPDVKQPVNENVIELDNKHLNETEVKSEDKPIVKPIEETKKPRIINLYGGRIRFTPDDVILLGEPDSTYILGLLFDYTCYKCRMMHAYVLDIERRYRGQIAFALFPFPLDQDCNPLVKKTSAKHEDACDLAQYAISIWNHAPEQFVKYDKYAANNKPFPKFQQVTKYVKKLLGNDYDQAMSDSQYKQYINHGIAIYKIIGKKGVPKIILPGQVLDGVPPKADYLFVTLEKALNVQPNIGFKDIQSEELYLEARKNYENKQLSAMIQNLQLAYHKDKQHLKTKLMMVWAISLNYTKVTSEKRVEGMFNIADSALKQAQTDSEKLMAYESLAVLNAAVEKYDVAVENQQKALGIVQSNDLFKKYESDVQNRLDIYQENRGLASSFDESLRLLPGYFEK